MDSKLRSRIQEELSALYLRLNGYFVSGFIVHSSTHGQNATELDLLGIRFPKSREPEREVGPDPILETSDQLVELVICEVKSRGQRLQFNDALTTNVDRLASVLRWVGLYEEEELQDIAAKLLAELVPTHPPPLEFPCVVGPRETRVRGVLCCPERASRRSNQARFIAGEAMLAYISRCLCPEISRAACTTTYDFGAWGPYERIVRYIKDRGSNNHGDIKDLYAHFLSGTAATLAEANGS